MVNHVRYDVSAPQTFFYNFHHLSVESIILLANCTNKPVGKQVYNNPLPDKSIYRSSKFHESSVPPQTFSTDSSKTSLNVSKGSSKSYPSIFKLSSNFSLVHSNTCIARGPYTPYNPPIFHIGLVIYLARGSYAYTIYF